MKLEAFIFDFDGTLADTLPFCIKSFQDTLFQVTGKEYSEDDITKHFGKTEEGIIKAIIPEKYQIGIDTYISIYEKNHHLCPKVFDGVHDLLDQLKNNNFKLAMVTGKGKNTTRISLKYFGLDHYFEFIEYGSPEGIIKAECIKRILKNWNIPPVKVAYVGDADTDVIEARNAGIIPVSVTWASTKEKNSAFQVNPDFIFHKIKDFKDWINTL